MKNNIQIKIIGKWIFLFNIQAIENKKQILLELEKDYHGSLGKYLFFSDDKELLIELAKTILIKHNLYNAKVPLTDVSKSSQGFGFVLCVYDSEPSLKHVLKEYIQEGINYRYWKSDSDTLKGKYSEKFKKEKKK